MKKDRNRISFLIILVVLVLIFLEISAVSAEKPSIVIISGKGGTLEQLEYLKTNIPGAVVVAPKKWYPISAGAEEVLGQLKEKGIDGKLILIGHSWGGLIAREIDAKNPGLVQKIITIATSSGGFRFTPRFIYDVDDGNSTTPLYVIAGYNSVQKKWHMKSGMKNDGTVGLESMLDFGRPIDGLKIFTDMGHMDFINSEKVVQQVHLWIGHL